MPSITFRFPSRIPLLRVLMNSCLSPASSPAIMLHPLLPFDEEDKQDKRVCLRCLTSQPTAVWLPLTLILLKSSKPPHLPNQEKTFCPVLRGLPESAGLLLSPFLKFHLSLPSFLFLSSPTSASLAGSSFSNISLKVKSPRSSSLWQVHSFKASSLGHILICHCLHLHIQCTSSSN